MIAVTIEMRLRGLESIETDCSGMTDSEAIRAGIMLIRAANYDPILAPSVRRFFAALALELHNLVSWRQEELDRIERALREVKTDEPELWGAAG